MKQSVIVYGTCNGVEKAAVEQLSQILLEETMEYPICISGEEYRENPAYRYFFLGTKQSNACLRERSRAVLNRPEEYCIQVERDTVVIEGYDAAGVLYGCVDFQTRYLATQELTHESGRYFRNLFEEGLPDARIQSAPAVKDRGLWTWGHVIYDYRGYLDHMVKLKMNTVIIWNDYPPVNAAQMVTYAHERNVKVIWGFSWLWSTDCQKASMDNLREQSDEIVTYYEKNYASLPGDGIYFQSFTETSEEYIHGVLIADAVTSFVNYTAARILERHPDLELQFGLHADSVRDRLDSIRNTDPRIRIVWENCGAFPFDYLPENITGFAETKAFTAQIAKLRGSRERFGVVLKGLTKLDWSAFHHLEGSSCLGLSTARVQENRLARKRKIWHYIQAGWLVNGDKACEMVRLLRQCTGGDLCVTALVEDGMFEKKLYYPVALLGELLWDCDTGFRELAYRVALRSDVEFA